ncbi:MAG: hypothetical protein J0H29_00285 [Sphingobacteriales bacterium]|nr:hypothetical protein [Sphingobacteriales bacterium]OJY80936.1 MAG: hypothetical protein BGP14_01725 [Sphingobacteriales bacterium 44-15]
MRIILYFIFLILFAASSSTAQIIFHFVPEVYARNLDALSTVQIQNMSAAANGQISITVRENSKRIDVVEITTPAFLVKQGINSIPKNAFGNSVLRFGNNSYGKILNQTKSFPPGDYSFCFVFIPSEKGSPEFENCFDALIEPLVPMQLLLPVNEDTICLKRPVLSWQPPMPYNGSMYFRLMLTEKKQARNGPEAMLKNAPLLLLDNITGTTLMYPANYPELKEGITYFWQVVAYQQGIIISTSEVWGFTVKCKEDAIVDNDSYRELKLLVNGNYYITGQYLKFSFLNNYNIKKLQYTILDINEGGKPVKRLPEIKLMQGLNKIDIDITDIGLKEGKTYILKVFPFNEPPVEVRFIYQ